VFVGLLVVTRFFHADELRRLRSLRMPSRRAPAAARSHDSTEKAGEIVATDIEVPE
jgi:hypothetical protein